MRKNKIIVLVIVILAVVVFYSFGSESYLNPNYFKSLYADNPLLTGIVFFITYIVATSFALPGAAILTMLCGYIFGFFPALIIVSFASSIGATISFLLARLFLRSWVQTRFLSYMGTLNKGVEKDGAFYLFTLRLIPVIPFFIINLVMGVMPIRVWTFYWVSQLGMLAGTAAFINAGVQVGAVTELSVKGVMTPELIGSLMLLGFLPFITKKILVFFRNN